MQVNRFFSFQLLFLSFFIKSLIVNAQHSGFNDQEFINIKVLDATPVKNQFNTNTCWSFAVMSLLESELLKQGKDTFDLSELFVVRHAYMEKAIKYVRMHGHINFTDGGEANDVIDIIRKYGIVPEEEYPFSIVNKKSYDREMDFKLKNYVNSIIDTESELEPSWINGFEDILNSYIGETPDTFTVNETEYTPHSYANKLELVYDDYIIVTSFTHHPFYSRFILELPDNWSWGQAYNVTLDELVEIIDSAVYKNYSVLWAADVSENEFDFRKGYAVVQELSEGIPEDTAGAIRNTNGAEINTENQDSIDYGERESIISQEKRQEGFDNYTTTDDHSMHIIGIGNDRNNNRYYYVKNSWGTNSYYKGYLYASQKYIRYKTILIMLNRKALPVKIASKLNIEF